MSTPSLAGGHHSGHGFGTLPVALAGISTILGAIMFLRFGYAVGHVGLIGAFLIIGLGHLVTFPTALALAEIATNRRVEGGGEYFIISRSFGTTIGGVIGLFLYLSQAISVAFYMIAFAEAFTPFTEGLDPRMVSLPALLVFMVIVFLKGADLGVKLLYVVVAVLMVSLGAFFVGSPADGFSREAFELNDRIADPDSFFVVFAIVFPAFTGMTAGVGLSGDLKNPRTSIPKGTLIATGAGLIAYVCIVLKLYSSAPPEALAENQLVMADIAWWGPIILIGLGSATLSSAIGSVLVAPRTLQALGADGNLMATGLSKWLAKGHGAANEPRNAMLITGMIALVIVALGNVDIVARLISMFFMVTYGALCAISFLEHFAARPSYRPAFRSRWYISLMGALMCLFIMFQMEPLFAFIAVLLMVSLYLVMRRAKGAEDDLASMFKGVMTQAVRYMNIRLQRHREDEEFHEWRPSIIMVDERTFERSTPLMMMRWLSYRHGFGTYLHLIRGFLNEKSHVESVEVKERLIEMASRQKSSVYMDTIVSPSMVSALAQALQVPGVTGTPNNVVMFEFSKSDPQELVEDHIKYCRLAASTGKTLLVLRYAENYFREKDIIHVWLRRDDKKNANMIILLSYILIGHPDWQSAEIKVFATVSKVEQHNVYADFQHLMNMGRLPVSDKNIELIDVDTEDSLEEMVSSRSRSASLVVLGFGVDSLDETGAEVFNAYPSLSEVLFVHAPEAISFE